MEKRGCSNRAELAIGVIPLGGRGAPKIAVIHFQPDSVEMDSWFGRAVFGAQSTEKKSQFVQVCLMSIACDIRQA
jgi:hypothetical protein